MPVASGAAARERLIPNFSERVLPFFSLSRR